MSPDDYMPENTMLREIILKAHCIFSYIHARLTQPVKCLNFKGKLMVHTYIKSCAQMIHNKSQPTPVGQQP